MSTPTIMAGYPIALVEMKKRRDGGKMGYGGMIGARDLQAVFS